MTDPAMNDWDVVRARLTPKWATGTPYDSPATNALDRLQARMEAYEAGIREAWLAVFEPEDDVIDLNRHFPWCDSLDGYVTDLPCSCGVAALADEGGNP